jgi:transposase
MGPRVAPLGSAASTLESRMSRQNDREMATTRKNTLFAGGDGRARAWAIFTSLIQSARLNGLDPFAYLKDVLEQIVSGRVRNHELDRLLPWTWKAQHTNGQATEAA